MNKRWVSHVVPRAASAPTTSSSLEHAKMADANCPSSPPPLTRHMTSRGLSTCQNKSSRSGPASKFNLRLNTFSLLT
jgi:hypothetical protein